MDDNQEEQIEDSIEQQLEDAKVEAEKNLTGWKRAQADFENYQKRKEGENQELIQFAREVAVAKLLPTLDSLSEALKHAPEIEHEEYTTWKHGLDGIVQQLDKALSELGVKKIETVGKKFDPNYHEAIREVESDKEPGTITEEYVAGYELNGKVIRASQVAISK